MENSKKANSLVLRAIFASENGKNANSLVLRAIFASESCKNANSLVLRACLGASGNLWAPLARKIRNMTLKTEAPVDYSLRMERLLFRLGWVEGLWKPLGAFGSLWEPFVFASHKNANSLVLRAILHLKVAKIPTVSCFGPFSHLKVAKMLTVSCSGPFLHLKVANMPTVSCSGPFLI
jgi:hypothetical protein